nr:peptidase C48, SUMO/sentrin/Ubl1 [Tanacetum cinerariifolium]
MTDKNDEINNKRNNGQDWSKVERTHDLIDYVYAKYENSWKKSDEAIHEMLDDLYNFVMLKGLSECKASESNIRRIRVKDIIKKVEDHLKTYSSAVMDISWHVEGIR